MTNNPKYAVDSATDLLGGVNEGFDPDILQTNEVSRAINVTFRGGFAKTRPGFLRRPMNFARGEYGTWYLNHIFQGYARYDDFHGMEKIVTSVGGRIFLIDPLNDYLVMDVTPRRMTGLAVAFVTGNAGTAVAVTVTDASLIFEGYPVYIDGFEFTLVSKSGNVLQLINKEQAAGVTVPTAPRTLGQVIVEYLNPNSPDLPIVWMEQAEQFLVIQDDQSLPIIFNGSTTRRAQIGIEVPTGSAMAYGRGRLWVAVNQGREFIAGDIAGGPTGVLGFTENTFLSGGGAFAIGANVGRIRAMKFVMNLDTSLGEGPLQVLCERAIYSVNAPTSREAWAVVTDPIQTESLINYGATSQYSTVLVNGDLFFRAEDGLRSFFIARRDFGTWGNTPVSLEMTRTLANDTQELLIHSCAVLFDNRLLFSSVPIPTENGVHHKCMVVLDFHLISTMKTKAPPAYDGFWTGLDVTGLVSGRFAGKTRCFAFTHDSMNQNCLWEITVADRYDNLTYPIESRVEYRSLSFPRQNEVSGLKRLQGAELWVNEFAGEVDFTLTYKPDQYPCWQEWAEKTICVVDDQCDEEDPCDSATTGTNMLGIKTRLGFGVPPDVNDTGDEKAMRAGFAFQPALSWTGYAVLNKFLVYAHEEEEWAMAPPSDDRSECAALQCCPPDPFTYRPSCGGPGAPILEHNEDDGSTAVSITYFNVPNVRAFIWHRVGDDFNIIIELVSVAEGYVTIGTQLTGASGDIEYFWVVFDTEGDCSGTVGQESSILVI